VIGGVSCAAAKEHPFSRSSRLGPFKLIENGLRSSRSVHDAHGVAAFGGRDDNWYSSSRCGHLIAVILDQACI